MSKKNRRRTLGTSKRNVSKDNMEMVLYFKRKKK